MSKIKGNLTTIQNKVIWNLQNGAVLITSSDMKGALVANDDNSNFWINNGVFGRLVDKGFIYQMMSHPFNYILTEEGKNIKTKPPTNK